MRGRMLYEKKYCFHCGKLIQSYVTKCPYCLINVKVSKLDRTKACKYCRKKIYVDSEFCEFCSTKIKKPVGPSELDIACEELQKKLEEENKTKPTINIFKTLNYYGCVEKFVGAKKVGIKCSPKEIKFQTLEKGQLIFKFDDIFACYFITKEEILRFLNLEINVETDIFSNIKFYIIETKEGYLMFEDELDTELVISTIYNNMSEYIVEFEYGFFNANHDEIFDKIEKMKTIQ